MSPGWYLRRLSRMGPAEVAGRLGDVVRRRRWRRELDAPVRETWLAHRTPAPVLEPGVLAAVPADAVARLTATADELVAGRAEYFGVPREDLVAPDWSRDPKTGRSAPADRYAFDIPYRSEDAVGDIKQIWEPSRHQHLTVLAAAYALTGEDRYATRVAEHLRSWWAANPPMRGVHWVSGIELGIRLLSWVWVRRLLDGWPGVTALFDDNPVALHQIRQHQRWLAAFPSRGSSANNHVIAEAAGQLAAATAFDWFPESPTWRSAALRLLDAQLQRNTFGSGLNRELATEYHGLVLELGLAAALEAHAAGVEVPETTWLVLVRMCDALAAVVDTRLAPPRQGDADDGHGLVLDGAGTHRWGSLLATGTALFGRREWWPEVAATDVRTPLLTALGKGVPVPAAVRPAVRPTHLGDAGLTVLRARSGAREIWCRCDGGPHGFLSIAAHAHADALSLEVRHGGVEILADPGTYCYHGQPRWRAYFRSTLGHNTLELAGRDQSDSGGPFLWTRHARSRVLAVDVPPEGGTARWSAEHDGYAKGPTPATHRRTVELGAESGELRVFDEVYGRGPYRARLAFHLGPAVTAVLEGSSARLTWTDEHGGHGAVLELPPDLSWSAHRGETDPPLGWYSPGFGRLEPATTLVGTGSIGGDAVLTTLLCFDR
ncbi:alginate lyase family protein [Actinophytocola xanthii]|uniref:Heparinase n=1 Tax=Actinophytocola xanthii TaxID=1912961 RepID=A0A1Q8CN01_9PSEU|nr:alginate lyase family protein [Actinophytocola xanthii]OLF15724.1 heparinase [Actinophytocola xanthii]